MTMQTTLQMKDSKWIEKFKKEHGASFAYVMEKYKVWKELVAKEEENAIQKSEAFRADAREGVRACTGSAESNA